MSRTGVACLAWISSRWLRRDRLISSARCSLVGSVNAVGTFTVDRIEAVICSGSTPARRPIRSTSGGLVNTRPSSSACLITNGNGYSPRWTIGGWRASMSTWVEATALCRLLLDVSFGGRRPIRPVLTPAETTAASVLMTSTARSWRPSLDSCSASRSRRPRRSSSSPTRRPRMSSCSPSRRPRLNSWSADSPAEDQQLEPDSPPQDQQLPAEAQQLQPQPPPQDQQLDAESPAEAQELEAESPAENQ